MSRSLRVRLSVIFAAIACVSFSFGVRQMVDLGSKGMIQLSETSNVSAVNVSNASRPAAAESRAVAQPKPIAQIETWSCGLIAIYNMFQFCMDPSENESDSFLRDQCPGLQQVTRNDLFGLAKNDLGLRWGKNDGFKGLNGDQLVKILTKLGLKCALEKFEGADAEEKKEAFWVLGGEGKQLDDKQPMFLWMVSSWFDTPSAVDSDDDDPFSAYDSDAETAPDHWVAVINHGEQWVVYDSWVAALHECPSDAPGSKMKLKSEAQKSKWKQTELGFFEAKSPNSYPEIPIKPIPLHKFIHERMNNDKNTLVATIGITSS